MPQEVITNLSNLIFSKGYLYATRYLANGTAGTTDAIAFGGLQNTSLNYSREVSEISGPESLSPLGVGIRGESLTGTSEYAVLHLEQLGTLLGGSIAYDVGTNETTFTKYVNDEPEPFDLRLKSPSDGSDLELILYRCMVTTYDILGSTPIRDFVRCSFSFRCYGNGDTQKLFSLIRPGDMTNAS